MQDAATHRPQRLFTAIALPAQIGEQLMLLRPPSHPAINRSGADQLHLTLCFIGPGYVDAVDELLREIPMPPLRLNISGLGRFRSRSGSSTLWAGVEASAALVELQARMARQLRPLLHRPDKRRYRPHITLARCKARTPAALIEAFLEQQTPGGLQIDTDQFGLYSSTTDDSGPCYTRERLYPL